jgi:hypothetical protein
MVYGNRAIHRYDAGGNLIRQVHQSYDIISNSYVNTNLYTYGNYQTITLANKQALALTAATEVYPNPTTSKATLKLAGLPKQEGSLQAQLLNSVGQVVQQFTLKPQQGVINQDLNLKDLKAGVYTLRLQTSEGTVVKRIVKQ